MATQSRLSFPNPPADSLTRLQTERDAIGAQYWSTQVSRARDRSILLVEGETDRTCVETALVSCAPLWSNRVFVIAVGGRAKVLDGLERGTLPGGVKLKQDPARIFGLVDRDVWTDQEVDAQRLRLPNLHVTEGWCMENSLLLNEHGRVLPALDSIDLEAWADSYALAWAIQSTIEANPQTPAKLYASVSPRRLDWSNLEQLEPIVTPLLPAGAQQWAAALSARSVVAKAAARRAALDGLGREEVLLKGIHGKVFMKASDVRGRLARPTVSADDVRLNLAPNLLSRPFMRALLQALGLTSP